MESKVLKKRESERQWQNVKDFFKASLTLIFALIDLVSCWFDEDA